MTQLINLQFFFAVLILSNCASFCEGMLKEESARL